MSLAIVFLAGGAVLVVVGAPLAGRAVGSAVARRGIPPGPAFGAAICAVGVGAATVIATGRGQMALAGGIPFGAVLFLLAATFGAAGLLGRRPLRVEDPLAVVVPAAAFLLAAVMAQDRAYDRFEGTLLALVEIPFLAWAGSEGSIEPPHAVPAGDEPARGAADPPLDPPEGARPGGWATLGRGVLGAALAGGGAALVVEGALRVADRAPLVPGFAGATLVGTITSLPFVLTVVFPRRRPPDADPIRATLGACVALVAFVPGVAALVRPFALDAPATMALLGAVGLYALCAAGVLVRGRGGKVLGAVTLAAYAAWLVYAGSL